MEPKDEIKQRLDIVETIADYIELKPAGSGSFKAVCPFHSEKSPSFHVSREKEIWHCFGCDKGGDVLSFVMEMEGLSFPDTLRMLGKRVGVEIPEYRSRQDSGERNSLLGIHELVGKFYSKLLHEHEDGKIAREYLKERGIDKNLAEKFNLGYTPNKWDIIVTFLRKRGFSDTQILNSGLGKKRKTGTGLIDRFRGRLMIPLCDGSGNIVGFTGRILEENEKAPKYLNSPETKIYHKSDILFGLHLSKKQVREKKNIIIVEGNLDVIASHKAGVENVVASSGTALGESQLRQLKKITNKLIFSFDVDEAGFKAGKRGIQLAQEMNFDILVIVIPENTGKDPDDVVQKDINIWKKLASNPVRIMDYYFSQGIKKLDTTNIDSKRIFAQFILSEIRNIENVVEKEHWLQKLSDIVHVDISVLRRSIEKNKIESSRDENVSNEHTSEKKITSKADQTISLLIGLMLMKDEYFDFITEKLDINLIKNQTWLAVYKDLKMFYTSHKLSDSTQNPFFKTIQSKLQNENRNDDIKRLNICAIRAEEAFQDMSNINVREEINRHIDILRLITSVYQRKELESAIRQAESVGDSARLKALMEQYKTLL